jgi:hypothetical protein
MDVAQLCHVRRDLRFPVLRMGIAQIFAIHVPQASSLTSAFGDLCAVVFGEPPIDGRDGRYLENVSEPPRYGTFSAKVISEASDADM